jgi:hypothetical protein
VERGLTVRCPCVLVADDGELAHHAAGRV